MEKGAKILIIAGIFLVITLLLGVYYNSNQIYAAPIELIEDLEKTDDKAFYSTNWAGYVAVKKDSNNITLTNTVKYVKGSWTVPEVDCTSTFNGNTYIWVGIDGYLSSTIEQIGTSSRCVNGNPEYFGWYEFYPNPPNRIDFEVQPGDNITAEVKYLPKKNKFRLRITNIDTGEIFSVTKKVPNAKRNSAEWIVEAPKNSSGAVVPLSDFNEVNFNNAETTIKGTSGKINDPSWSNYEVDMFYSGGLKADTSSLSESGDSFSVDWLHE